MDNFLSAMFICALVVFGALVGALLEFGRNRDNLVKLNHAEYYLDENHERQFRLKECK
jgi:hypothetical protein